MATGKTNTNSSTHPQDITEVHPNPHGEQDIAEMPLKTDHGAVTRENVGQSTSTRENHLNPSVTGPLEDPTTDSMFNSADPQTREIEKGTEKDSSRRKKTSGKRKAA
ncbi:MAG TPA: hypothetical protein VI636_18055 [Candidatus Angelobacter sp.]